MHVKSSPETISQGCCWALRISPRPCGIERFHYYTMVAVPYGGTRCFQIQPAYQCMSRLRISMTHLRVLCSPTYLVVRKFFPPVPRTPPPHYTRPHSYHSPYATNFKFYTLQQASSAAFWLHKRGASGKVVGTRIEIIFHKASNHVLFAKSRAHGVVGAVAKRRVRYSMEEQERCPNTQISLKLLKFSLKSACCVHAVQERPLFLPFLSTFLSPSQREVTKRGSEWPTQGRNGYSSSFLPELIMPLQALPKARVSWHVVTHCCCLWVAKWRSSHTLDLPPCHSLRHHRQRRRRVHLADQSLHSQAIDCLKLFKFLLSLKFLFRAGQPDPAPCEVHCLSCESSLPTLLRVLQAKPSLLVKATVHPSRSQPISSRRQDRALWAARGIAWCTMGAQLDQSLTAA